MSETLIQTALELRLASLSPTIATAAENETFTPQNGVPYKMLSFLPNTPSDLVLGRKLTELRGFFYITLMYPPLAGRAPAQAYAAAIREHFRPCQTLVYSSQKVYIDRTAEVRPGVQDEGRWRVLVIVPWRAYLAEP